MRRTSASSVGKHVETHRHAADQPHRAAQRLARVADRGDGVLQILEDAVAQLEQRFAGRRDADAAADAVEDRLAELVLEQQDLAADGRLGDVQLFAGGRERAGVGDGADDFELPQVHASAYMRTRHESILCDDSVSRCGLGGSTALRGFVRSPPSR